jgi:putative nucleotidyltransferase with HDIG domain
LGLLAADTRALPWAAARSVTLLRVFLAASAAILVAGASVLGTMLTRALTSQAIGDRRESVTQYVDGVLRPRLVRRGRVTVAPHTSALLLGQLKRQRGIVSVKVWRPDGTLAWTNRAQSRIGRRFPLEDDLGETIRENRTTASIDRLDTAEDSAERELGLHHVLEVYAPVQSDDGARAIGAYEIYADAAPLERSIGSRKHLIWAAVAGVFLALYVALALLVRGASTTLRRQTHQLKDRSRALLDSYRRLEESSLEAIESLNATVEAKDPYTAGHSQRVQRVALALGNELGLPHDRLDALRFGALFHDIGKIAVPDSILVKPEGLSYWEYAQMKLHSVEGARIVGKFGRLRAAVPIIRHHHERWDGNGYPDGLAADEIPLEAAIAGLADAWDAMTTDRPYARALSAQEALAELRAGCGTQFAPAVVDAFFAAARRRPSEFRLEGDVVAAAAGA